MLSKKFKVCFCILISLLLTGCFQIGANHSIVKKHADALLTKNNELQFRFKINDKVLRGKEMYKVKVSIHNKKLASSLGTNEIVYGANAKYEGKYIEVNNNKEYFIYMEPIPLMKDLHVFEIEDMISNEEAVSVEVYNDEEVIAKAFLTNFSSQF